jgi:hypothetical protein
MRNHLLHHQAKESAAHTLTCLLNEREKREMKLPQPGLLVIVLIAVMACTAGQSTKQNFTREEAAAFLADYTQSLAAGDTAKVKSYWCRQSLARKGFWYMHAWRGHFLRFAEWQEFLRDFTFEIADVQAKADYYLVEIKWMQKSRSVGTRNEKKYQPREMLYYVIREEARWALINPIDVLTRDWHTYETDFLRFYYPNETNIQEHLAELKFMEGECEKVLKIFGLNLDNKIDFYKARTPAECGDLLLQPPSNGLAAIGFSARDDNSPWSQGMNIVVSTSFINPHEVAHVLTALAGIPYLNAAFMEGLASALGGNTQTTAEFTLIEARNLLDHPMHFSLQELLTLSDADFLRNNFVTYIEAGAFIRFLIDRYGIEKLKKLHMATKFAAELHNTFPRIYGYSISELETQLQDYLSKLEVPQIEFAVPSDAELIFAMADPAGDDVGDGDYTYPRHERFTPGVFDLRKFEVFKDHSRAYFRLEFQNMMTPVSYGSSTERFAPGAVIAFDKSGKRDRHLGRYCHGVQFEDEEGYDLKLNVGLAVSVSDSFGKVYFSTPDVYDCLFHREDNTVEFSFPLDFIGEPEHDWKYFVGVGLVSDRTMNFLFGGPMSVYKSHPIFISGGNYDFGNPAFIDILLPEEKDQAKILNNHDAKKGLQATVPMVGR